MFAGKVSDFLKYAFILNLLFVLPLFAQEITFGDQIILSTDVEDPYTVFAADLDGDGDKDIISGASAAYGSLELDPLLWFENLDGNGSYGHPQIVYQNLDMSIGFVLAFDFDGDGDNDIVASSEYGNPIFSLENIDSQGNFDNYTIITESVDMVSCLRSGDIDGDGDLDLVSASRYDDKIAWYENSDGNGTFGPQQILTSDARHASCVAIADMDGDDDLDIGYTATFYDELGWFENLDGEGDFSDERVISTNIDSPNSLDLADINGDFFIDAVVTTVSSNEGVYWFENTGSGNFGNRQTIYNNPWQPSGVVCVDLDNDGDMDVAYGSESSVYMGWCENLNGQGNFGAQQEISTYLEDSEWIICEDLDNDDDPDLLSFGTSNDYDNIAWFANDGSGNFGDENIVNPSTHDASAVTLADLDGDGDNDVVIGADGCNRIGWYENLDGEGNYGSLNVITDDAGAVFDVQVYDIDGDNDIDIISANYYGEEIKWYENTDGFGDFSTEHVVIEEGGITPFRVYCTDIDNDNDLDIVSSAYEEDMLVWFENIDGNGNYGNYQIIGTDIDFPDGVFAADLDNDGDNDVLAASRRDDNIVWFENTDGLGSFGDVIIIDTDMSWAKLVSAADIDGDGDLDVLASKSSGGGLITWYENTDGNASFGERQIVDYLSDSPCSIIPTDLDSDGDIDVVTGAYQGEGLIWYENIDGLGDFSESILISNQLLSPTGVAAGDADGDGDLDVFSASEYDGKIAWYQNEFEGIAPEDFNLIAPENQSTITTLEVLLEWEEAEDADNNIVEYRIYIAEDEASVLDSVYSGILATDYTFTGINGETYWWTISAVDGHNHESWANQIYSFTIDYDGVRELRRNDLPKEYALSSIYPNPFNPLTTIELSLPLSSQLSLNVYNLLGQRVETLYHGDLNAGYYNFILNGENMASGMYFIHAYVPGKLDIKKKVILTK